MGDKFQILYIVVLKVTYIHKKYDKRLRQKLYNINPWQRGIPLAKQRLLASDQRVDIKYANS